MGLMPAPQRPASSIATGRDAAGVLGLAVNLPLRVTASRRGAAGPLLAQQRQGYTPWRTRVDEEQQQQQDGYFSASSVLDEGSTTTSSDEPWYLPNARGATRRTPRPAVALPALPRHQPATPRPVPIIHSSAYQQALVQTRTMSPGVVNSDDEDPAVWQRVAPGDGDGTAPSGESAAAAAAAAAALPPAPTGTVLVRAGKRSVTRPGAAGSPGPFQGSALEWALHKADASLDELEDNPLPLQKAVYEISRGPVGTATSNAVQAAAKLTVKGAVEVAKMAAPIGKWALQEGAKAAAGLITRAILESVKTPQGSRKDVSKDAGSGKPQGGGLTGTMLLKRRSPTPPPPQPSRQQQQQQQQRKGR